MSDSALVWEGTLGPSARFVVSGLNLSSVWTSPAQPEPVAGFLFGKLLSYAVAEAAAIATKSSSTNVTDAHVTDAPIAVDLMSGKIETTNNGFCAAGKEQACQLPAVPSGVCNANFEIVMEAHLDHDAVVDAVHPRLSLPGAHNNSTDLLTNTPTRLQILSISDRTEHLHQCLCV